MQQDLGFKSISFKIGCLLKKMKNGYYYVNPFAGAHFSSIYLPFLPAKIGFTKCTKVKHSRSALISQGLAHLCICPRTTGLLTLTSALCSFIALLSNFKVIYSHLFYIWTLT